MLLGNFLKAFLMHGGPDFRAVNLWIGPPSHRANVPYVGAQQTSVSLNDL